MLRNSNWLIWLTSAGYGVLMSLALNGAVRISSWLVGNQLSQDSANLLFLLSCLVLVPITSYFQLGRLFLKPAPTQT